MSRRARPCSWPALPHALTHARLYPAGWRCDRHAPWALAGWPSWTRPVNTTKEDR